MGNVSRKSPRLVSQVVGVLSEELGLNGSPKIMQIVSAELVSPLCYLLSWENFPSITYIVTISNLLFAAFSCT